jgi:hypothetical protein
MTLTILPEILIPQLYICASNTQDFFYNRNYVIHIILFGPNHCNTFLKSEPNNYSQY